MKGRLFSPESAGQIHACRGWIGRQVALVILCLLGACPAVRGAPGWETEIGGNAVPPRDIRGAAFFQNELYVAGSPTGPDYAKGSVRRWTGHAWQVPGEGIHGYANTVLAAEDKLYVGGGFDLAGTNQANNLAVWDGRNWSPILCGQTNGVSGTVEAMAIDGHGRLIVTGNFRQTNQPMADAILAWDGHEWSKPGGGLRFHDGISTYAFAVTPDGQIFLGLSVYGKGTNYYTLALRCDATGWHRMEVPISLQKLAVLPDGTVYCGGEFRDDSPQGRYALRRWDGNAWLPLNGDTDEHGHPAGHAIDSMCVWRGELVVSGEFRRIGEVECYRIARYDGTNWFPFGAGLRGGMRFGFTRLEGSGSGIVEAGAASCLAPMDGDLVAFGMFTQAGTIGVPGVAVWNGTNWLRLAETRPTGVNLPIRALVADGEFVYAAGDFTTVGDAVVGGLARWNGLKWQGFPEPVPAGKFNFLAADKGRVFASAAKGGGDKPGDDLLEWSDGHFHRLPQLCFDARSPVAARDGLVYVQSYGMRRWDSIKWTQMGRPPPGMWKALAVSPKGEVYLGGGSGGNAGPPHVLYWTGKSWEPLGGGLGGGFYANALCVAADGALYAGGDFTQSRALTAEDRQWTRRGLPPTDIIQLNRVARWDGERWRPLGLGIPSIDPMFPQETRVEAIAVAGSQVFVGGRFNRAGNVAANGVAMWDGQQWHALGSGVLGEVYALAVCGDHLYVGGRFNQAGGTPAMNFARWRLH